MADFIAGAVRSELMQDQSLRKGIRVDNTKPDQLAQLH